MTSHDVVARARRVLSVRKVGHAGTLDPMATGLLVLGVGAATRLLGYVGGHDKTYEATIRLGRRRSPTTARARCCARRRRRDLDDAAIRAALAGQTGPLQQVPSSVSAVKVEAAAPTTVCGPGEAVELAPRSVTVHALEVHRITRPTPDLVDVDVTVSCTAGTYIRAIARDAGAALGVGGHLTALRRTASGPFGVAEAAAVEDAGAALLAGGGRVPAADRAARTVFPVRTLTVARPGPSATASGSRPRARRACTPRSTPTAGWPRSSRTPAAPPGWPSDSRPRENLLYVSTLDDRLDALAAEFAPLPGVLVAFSGGVDSGVVLAAAVRTLGADRVVAATAVSPSLPASERGPASDSSPRSGCATSCPAPTSSRARATARTPATGARSASPNSSTS